MTRASGDVGAAVDALWRIESPRLIAHLARTLGDLGAAEEVAQDAFVAALERWRRDGVPSRPGGGLMQTARFLAIDRLRRDSNLDRKHQEVAAAADVLPDTAEESWDDVDAALDGEIRDDMLRLVFVACHPVLATDARVALTLKVVGGLSTDEIARAFLVRESTVAQRIVRAKRTLAQARVPFEVPAEADRNVRLYSVLEVIYLVFNEGYAATAGEDWMRPRLCADALRLGRVLAELLPAESEVHGLVALMELQASRLRARVDRQGNAVLLADQDRRRWDLLLINRGLAALARAESLDGPLGPYALQAAIAACHARARTAAETDWVRIVALYDALAQISRSPVVELNRAVAVSRAFGAEAGLEIVERLLAEPALQGYHLLPSVHADLLARLGRRDEAVTELTRAVGLAQNQRERDLLLRRAADLSVAPRSTG